MTLGTVLRQSSVDQQEFLPDFCANRTVLIIVLTAELLAFVLAISSVSTGTAFWLSLAFYSLYIQWVALTSTVMLCVLRRPLARISILSKTVLVYSVTQAITALTTIAATWLTTPSNWQADPYILARNHAVSSIVTLMLLRYLYVQQQWKLNIRAETEARFKALQARIRPHFLFNSMNTIVSLIYQQPRQAEQNLLDLCDLFRSNLRQRDRIPLAEELELARRYLSIEKSRLGSRLTVHWRLPEQLPQLRMPPLILQPLLENAVYHGIEPRSGGGEIEIDIAIQCRRIAIRIDNDLATTTSQFNHRSRSVSRGNGIALDNIRQRLALAYDEQAQMFAGQVGERYRIEISLPTQSVTQ